MPIESTPPPSPQKVLSRGVPIQRGFSYKAPPSGELREAVRARFQTSEDNNLCRICSFIIYNLIFDLTFTMSIYCEQILHCTVTLQEGERAFLFLSRTCYYFDVYTYIHIQLNILGKLDMTNTCHQQFP